MSFGLTVFAGLVEGIIGVIQIAVYPIVPSMLVWMAVGGLIIFATGVAIYLSFKKGILEKQEEEGWGQRSLTVWQKT